MKLCHVERLQQDERTCTGCRKHSLHHTKPVSSYVVSYDLQLKGRLYVVTSIIRENGKRINRTCIFFYVYTSFVSARVHCHYVIPSYHSNEMLSVNTQHEHNLRSILQTTQKSFVPVYRVYSVRIYNILMWIRELQ
jgi:hypothetical protein